MTEQTLIDSAQVPELALDFMNHDHAEAVEMVNRLYQLVGKASNEEIDSLLEALYLHNAEHFNREEEHMQTYGFPPYPVHKGEHDRVLAELRAVIRHWQTDRDTATLQHYLQDTFVNWFSGHLMSMDRVTAMFVAGQMAETTPA